jgi:outer membrane lipopolysaccharide assembly protein LptE/RlpB
MGRPRAARAAALVLAAGLLATGGCSYSPNPALFPPHLRTLAVPVFENRTTEPNLDQEVTEAVVRRFVANNRLRVVSESEADLVVTGAIVRYSNAVFGFNAREQAQEYQVAVTVSVTVHDRVKNREMWRDDNLVRTSNYFVVAVPGQQVQDQVSARADAIDKIAEAVINRTVEGW